MRCASVEFCHLARLHDEVVLAQPQPQAAGEHVHPLVALVALLLPSRLARRGDHLVGADPARLARQRDQGPAASPHRPDADPRIPGRGRADQFVQRHLIGAGQGQQQLQGRLAAAGFQPGQRADPVGATAVPGVWVAGNLANLQAQVITAAAAGLAAGAAINYDLILEETGQAAEKRHATAGNLA